MYHRRKQITSFLGFLLVLAMLFSVLGTAATAADTDAVNGDVRFTVTQHADDTATLAFEIKGENLARTQCAALAFDKTALTLIDASGKTVAAPTANAPLSALDASFVTASDGWNTTTVPSEYASASSIGTLILYATADAPVNLYGLHNGSDRAFFL